MSDTGAPLAGRSVVVTRSAAQSKALSAPLEALGASVLACPTISTVDPLDPALVERAVDRLASGEYDWLVLTSANSVDRFFDAWDRRSAAELPERTRVAAVGAATERRLMGRGVRVDLVPAEYRAEGLVEEFLSLGADSSWRVLLPRAEEAREILPDTLRSFGSTVDVVPVYRTVAAPLSAVCTALFRAGAADVVTFTSPTTVRHLCAGLAQDGLDPVAVLNGLVTASIGPVTSDELRRCGIQVGCEADPSTVEGLVAAIVARLSAG